MTFVRSGYSVKIAVYDLNPAGKETVLFLHGWPLSHKIFEYQAGMLVEKGYRVVGIDLRGFGASDTTATGYSYNQMADDVYAVVRACKLCRFTLVGFSMGGAIALRYMARCHAFGVKKLILLAAAAPSFTKRPSFSYGQTLKEVDALIEQARTDRPKLCADFAKKLFYREKSAPIYDWINSISLSASGIATVQTACALRDEDTSRDFAAVHVPTGILHGQKDVVCPFQLAVEQQEAIQGSVLIPLSESGHGIFYDELERFNSCFCAFLES